VHNGISVKVDFHTINSDKLKRAIVEVLHSPRYRKNVLKKSKLFRDQPEKPMDRAVWWCEYVIRNPKPNHLKSSEFNFGLLGAHFWDIQLIIVVVVFFLIWLLLKIIRSVCASRKIEADKKNK
jgi:glucuronosyltransferase